MDLKLIQDGSGIGWDIGIAAGGGDLVTDDGLETSVILSLFTDRRAEPDDVLPAENDADRRGWWGDANPMVEGHRLGSRLWLLARSKRTNETLRRAEEYAREALAWMLDTGVAARIETLAEAQGERLALRVTIHRPQGDEFTRRFDNIWEGQAA